MMRKLTNPDAAFLISNGKGKKSGKVTSGNHRGQKTATTVTFPFSAVYARLTINTFIFSVCLYARLSVSIEVMRVRRFVCLIIVCLTSSEPSQCFYQVSNAQFPPPSHSAEECGQTDNSARMPPLPFCHKQKFFLVANWETGQTDFICWRGSSWCYCQHCDYLYFKEAQRSK